MTMLREGSSGDDVRDLQQRLANVNFDPGPADGVFGPHTDKAVRAFQSAQGLLVDGVAGPKTMAALEQAGQQPPSSVPPPAAPPHAKPDTWETPPSLPPHAKPDSWETPPSIDPPPRVVRFTVRTSPDDGLPHPPDSVQVEEGLEVALEWSVEGASRVRITPNLGELPADPSSVTVAATKNVAYQLQAVASDGRVSPPAQVAVHTHPPEEVISTHIKLDGEGVPRTGCLYRAQIFFGPKSAVVLPGAAGGGNYLTTAIADAIALAMQCPDDALIVAGHCETGEGGTSEDDFALSRYRSFAVAGLLFGKRESFVAGAMQYPAVDEVIGPLRAWARAQGAQLPDRFDAAGWGRVFDLYEQALAREIAARKIDKLHFKQARKEAFEQMYGQLVRNQQQLGNLGCGSLRKAGGGQNERRVDILFARQGEVPAVPCHPGASSCDAKQQCDLYDDRLYHPRDLTTPDTLAWNVSWDRARATSFDSARMTLRAPGQTDGTHVDFIVLDGNGKACGRFPATIANAVAAVTVTDWNALAHEAPAPAANYCFHAATDLRTSALSSELLIQSPAGTDSRKGPRVDAVLLVQFRDQRPAREKAFLLEDSARQQLQGKTDGSGRATVSAVAPGGITVTLEDDATAIGAQVIPAPDSPPPDGKVVAAASAPAMVTVTLAADSPSPRVHATLLWKDQQPVANRAFTIQGLNAEVPLTTGADGTAEIPSARRGAATFALAGDSGAIGRQPIPEVGDPAAVVVTLGIPSPAAKLDLALVWQDGTSPVRSRAFTVKDSRGAERTFRTGAGGLAQLAELAPGEAHFALLSAPASTVSVAVEDKSNKALATADSAVVAIPVQSPAAKLELLLFWNDGSRARDAALTLRDSGGASFAPTTGDDGSALVAGIGAGPLSIALGSDAAVKAEGEVPDGEPEPQLAAAFSVPEPPALIDLAFALQWEDGAAAPQQKFTLIDSAGQSHDGVSGTDGSTAALKGVASGDALLFVHASSAVQSRFEVPRVAGAPLLVKLDRPPSAGRAASRRPAQSPAPNSSQAEPDVPRDVLYEQLAHRFAYRSSGDPDLTSDIVDWCRKQLLEPAAAHFGPAGLQTRLFRSVDELTDSVLSISGEDPALPMGTHLNETLAEGIGTREFAIADDWLLGELLDARDLSLPSGLVVVGHGLGGVLAQMVTAFDADLFGGEFVTGCMTFQSPGMPIRAWQRFRGNAARSLVRVAIHHRMPEDFLGCSGFKWLDAIRIADEESLSQTLLYRFGGAGWNGVDAALPEWKKLSGFDGLLKQFPGLSGGVAAQLSFPVTSVWLDGLAAAGRSPDAVIESTPRGPIIVEGDPAGHRPGADWGDLAVLRKLSLAGRSPVSGGTFRRSYFADWNAIRDRLLVEKKSPDEVKAEIDGIYRDAAAGTLGSALMKSVPFNEAPASAAKDQIDRLAEAAARAFGSLQVSVRTGTGKGLSGATLELDGPTPATAVVDEQGMCEFKELIPGTYTVRARKPGYFVPDLELSVTSASAQRNRSRSQAVAGAPSQDDNSAILLSAMTVPSWRLSPQFDALSPSDQGLLTSYVAKGGSDERRRTRDAIVQEILASLPFNDPIVQPTMLEVMRNETNFVLGPLSNFIKTGTFTGPDLTLLKDQDIANTQRRGIRFIGALAVRLKHASGDAKTILGNALNAYALQTLTKLIFVDDTDPNVQAHPEIGDIFFRATGKVGFNVIGFGIHPDKVERPGPLAETAAHAHGHSKRYEWHQKNPSPDGSFQHYCDEIVAYYTEFTVTWASKGEVTGSSMEKATNGLIKHPYSYAESADLEKIQRLEHFMIGPASDPAPNPVTVIRDKFDSNIPADGSWGWNTLNE